MGRRPQSKRDMALEQEVQDGGPMTGIIGTGNNPNGILGDLPGGSRDDNDEDDHDWDYSRRCAEWDDAECADIYPAPPYHSGDSHWTEASTEILRARDATALQNCTACEAALYSIVKQLQTLFKGSANTPIPPFGPPRLTEAVQRLRIDTIDTAIDKRCDGTKC